MNWLDELQRLMLFSGEAYAATFRPYHAVTWPVALALGMISAWVLRRAWRGENVSPAAVYGVLAAAWGWVGALFHGYHYVAINFAAYGFALLFLVVAGWLAVLAWVDRRRAAFAPAVGRVRLGIAWSTVVLAFGVAASLHAVITGRGVHAAGMTPDTVAWLGIGLLAVVSGRLRWGPLLLASLWLPVSAITALLVGDVASLGMTAAAAGVAATAVAMEIRERGRGR